VALVTTDPLANLKANVESQKANFKGQLDNRKKTNADFQSQLDSETAAHETADPLANLKANCESMKADCDSQLGSQRTT
jgi:hypothetical protein